MFFISQFPLKNDTHNIFNIYLFDIFILYIILEINEII